MSCPNNGSVLSTGSLQEVLQRCGTPVSQNQYTKNVTVTQQWEYYKVNGTVNTRLKMIFTNGKLMNIQITDGATHATVNATSSGICGALVQNGSSLNQVQAACGTPALKLDLAAQVVETTELTYSGSQQNTLVFTNGEFTEIR